MLCNPLLHLYGEPEAVNAEGDNGQKEPLDIIAEELTTSTGEAKAVTVDNGVFNYPRLLQANSPRSTETQCENDDESLQNANAYHTK